MSAWNLHWLSASGDLSPQRARVSAEVQATRDRMNDVINVPDMDILIQRRSRGVIPELGVGGFAQGENTFLIVLDPENPALDESLQNGALGRVIAHEAHHCMRMSGPGYGGTLGEALVSEGLAGQFVSMLFASGPEPWERAVDRDTIALHAPDEPQLLAADYDHESWFFGTDGVRPRWLGYTLGYRMASAWLETAPTIDVGLMVNVPASTVISAWNAKYGALLGGRA